MANERQDRDLVLSPNTFAHVLDTTKGVLKVYVGPYMNSLSQTDQLVVFDAASRRFQPQPQIDRAIQVSPIAAEGQYIVLSNPAASREQPKPNSNSPATDLDNGRKINVPGPISFPLWPGQTAQTIDGHHLRNNQYLIVRVYDEAAAKANWRKAVMKPAEATVGDQGPSGASTTRTDTPSAPRQDAGPASMSEQSAEAPVLTMGQLIIIKGTDVSFYIPPTGIEVVPENGTKFVREAVTLEMLEYCLLLDESGEKRYVVGPAVVFPKPTERFVVNKDADVGDPRKHQAIELNPHSGLYVKVIADYDDHKVGEELFITGRDTPIYFPRIEHSVISYDGRQKHYAIAIPAGEGRYVLDRDSGKIDLIVGPSMFLPDPRKQVVVRRILDPQTIKLLYPGNQEALDVNAQYLHASASLAPGAYLESTEQARAAQLAAQRTGRVAESGVGEFRRGSVYSPPRTIVLDTKYEGAVAVNIWPGYAILVTKKTGERRVEVGPKMVLLQYDETLMPLELSMGRPKDDKNLVRTCYLRVLNNQVGDIVTVETADLVKVDVEVSYRVNFVGDDEAARLRWFSVENYVKVLTDHARSRMRNAAKRKKIQEFYGQTIDIVRDALLGEVPEGGKRAGMAFSENGMQVYDVEVLRVEIKDRSVAQLLVQAQSNALAGAIRVSEATDEAERTKKLEGLARDTIDEQELTAKKRAEQALGKLKREIAQRVEAVAGELEEFAKADGLRTARLASERASKEQSIDLARKDAAQFLERLKGETEQYIARANAVDDKLVAAMTFMGDQAFVEKVIATAAPAAAAMGVTTADIFKTMFAGTPFEPMMKSLAERPLRSIEGRRPA